MREIKKIIVHCSASDYPEHDNIETIARWHVEERGWQAIGYHLVITKDGTPYNGRDIWVQGAHCLGQNHDSIGTCLTGLKHFTQSQFKTLKEVIDEYAKGFGLSLKDVYPHNYFDNTKTCPNFDLKKVLGLQ